MRNHLTIWDTVARAQREIDRAIKEARTIRSTAATSKVISDIAIEQTTRSRELLGKLSDKD